MLIPCLLICWVLIEQQQTHFTAIIQGPASMSRCYSRSHLLPVWYHYYIIFILPLAHFTWLTRDHCTKSFSSFLRTWPTSFYCSTLITQCRNLAKNVGCFRRYLFVCVWVCVFVCMFANMITSERVITLEGSCIVQKSQPSSNLGVIALCSFVWIAIICHIRTYLTIQSHSPGGATFPACWRSHCSRQWLRRCNVWRAAMTLAQSAQAV